ncbi:Uncharacterized protein T09A5.7 [Toxocara canis]|uniref:Mediator of RNA polymerase II transcription subunit 10 n=1 Tax=Toxocara canis TaxID=6265 RepID=A0A0B2VZR3_TOXCA|nr:Uncharacterized protein T09A5.7 [Toxocara canis]
MAERHMPSIFPECDQLKQVYDRCFTNFFEHFISPEYSQNSNANPCEQIYESYRRCVEKRLTESQLYDIDLEELRRRVLNTDDDRLRDHQEKEKSQELDHLKNQFMDVKIPLELLEYLDQGKNPQLYTKECLERTLNKNKEVNGKIEIYKKFRAVLLKELGEEMPNDTILYRNLRDRKESSPPHENDMDDGSD